MSEKPFPQVGDTIWVIGDDGIVREWKVTTNASFEAMYGLGRCTCCLADCGHRWFVTEADANQARLNGLVRQRDELNDRIKALEEGK